MYKIEKRFFFSLRLAVAEVNRDPTLLPGVRIVPEIVRCVYEFSRIIFFV